jgi:putative selenate reductase molybdopterin-binding subunit
MADDTTHPRSPFDPPDPTRRSFLRGALGAAAAAAALAGGRSSVVQIARAGAERQAEAAREPHWADIQLRVNGELRSLHVRHERTLLLALREDLGLTGTKKSCNLGQCGACTVIINDRPAYACLTLAIDAVGRNIVTIEGLGQNGLHPVQQGFIEQMGSQCGHCTPGMIMSGVALLHEHPSPTPDQVRTGLSGVLCRCGNYVHEIRGVLAAAAGTAPAPLPVVGTQLGSSVPMRDAEEKARGTARYTGDLGFHQDDPVHQPLVAKVLRSPFPHAEPLEIDDSDARRLPGFRGMITYRDLAGYKGAQREIGGTREPVCDRHFLNGKARYVGDAVAAVAADDEYAAQEALSRLRVRWRQLETYADAEHNLATNLTAIHDGGPVAGFGRAQPADTATIEFRMGDVAQGLREADLVVEGRYHLPWQCHLQIEPHCAIARWDGDELTLWDSQQSVHAAQHVLAEALHMAPEKIRVIAHYVGGGFGGKCTDTCGKTLYQGIAALLAKRTGRPVRLEYTLKEQILAEDTRNPFVFEIRTGVKKDGTLTALDCRAVQPTGGYASSGPAVVAVAGEGILNTYRIPHFWYRGYSVYTNSPVGGEMRGFGHPQAVFAREAHIDKVAEALGMNPLEFRMKNCFRDGDPLTVQVAAAVHQRPAASAVGLEECVRRGAEAISWSQWTPPSAKSGRVRRGLGMRISQEHSGRADSDGLIWIDLDGRIHVPVGSGNLGTEAHTAIALIVAEALGVPLSQIDVSWGDTRFTAWDFVTDASRAVHCTGKAFYNAALDLLRQVGRPLEPLRAGARVDWRAAARRAPTRTELTPYCDPQLDINPLLNESTGAVTEGPEATLKGPTLALARDAAARGGLIGLGYYVWNPRAQSWGASFAEVEVDMETGEVRVLQLVGAHDVGRVIHRRGVNAQVHGGGVMGFGYSITEELLLDPQTHIPVNQTLYEYRPPTILDPPEPQPVIVEMPVEAGPFGACGLGENPIWDAPAAVANAIYNATGMRLDQIPAATHRMYELLRRRDRQT